MITINTHIQRISNVRKNTELKTNSRHVCTSFYYVSIVATHSTHPAELPWWLSWYSFELELWSSNPVQHSGLNVCIWFAYFFLSHAQCTC